MNGIYLVDDLRPKKLRYGLMIHVAMIHMAMIHMAMIHMPMIHMAMIHQFISDLNNNQIIHFIFNQF